jgi:hypothetical protein
MRVAAKNQGAPGTASNSPMSSPARRLIRCRDAVSPAASLDLAANPGTEIRNLLKYINLLFDNQWKTIKKICFILYVF